MNTTMKSRIQTLQAVAAERDRKNAERAEYARKDIQEELNGLSGLQGQFQDILALANSCKALGYEIPQRFGFQPDTRRVWKFRENPGAFQEYVFKQSEFSSIVLNDKDGISIGYTKIPEPGESATGTVTISFEMTDVQSLPKDILKNPSILETIARGLKDTKEQLQQLEQDFGQWFDRFIGMEPTMQPTTQEVNERDTDIKRNILVQLDAMRNQSEWASLEKEIRENPFETVNTVLHALFQNVYLWDVIHNDCEPELDDQNRIADANIFLADPPMHLRMDKNYLREVRGNENVDIHISKGAIQALLLFGAPVTMSDIQVTRTERTMDVLSAEKVSDAEVRDIQSMVLSELDSIKWDAHYTRTKYLAQKNPESLVKMLLNNTYNYGQLLKRFDDQYSITKDRTSDSPNADIYNLRVESNGKQTDIRIDANVLLNHVLYDAPFGRDDIVVTPAGAARETAQKDTIGEEMV